tara:strand:- start:439 stop:717 length:279 start_codon:yes stop_codon:yes gene_type:complete
MKETNTSPLDGFLFITQFDIIKPEKHQLDTETGEVLFHRGDYITPAEIDNLARLYGMDIFHLTLCTSEHSAQFAEIDAECAYREVMGLGDIA